MANDEFSRYGTILSLAPPEVNGLPILYEDDEEGELGESSQHVTSEDIIHNGLLAHLVRKRKYRVFSNMNLYYKNGVSPLPYVSPDIMVVTPRRRLPQNVSSYFIGRDGPVPILTMEVLSERSWQQRDGDEKVLLYAKLGVREYILVDPTGEYMPQRLLLKRLTRDQSFDDHQDADGGVTSRLGFRLIIDNDGLVRVLDAKSGKSYLRPQEAQQAQAELDKAREQIRKLEAENARLRKTRRKRKP